MQKDKLEEKDFIHESYGKNPGPLWFWLCITVFVVFASMGINRWFVTEIRTGIAESPFLQVTNREMSLFLWQFPEHMRINAKTKSGYLPGFQYIESICMEPELTEKYVVAPPKVLFLYHTWNRLLRQEFTKRSIRGKELQEFLKYCPEWLPTNWPDAPKKYFGLIKRLKDLLDQDLNSLSEKVLPLEVRMAFQGWKNYIKEGSSINALIPNLAQVREFLKSHPHYSRNYWRNIVMETTPEYLLGVETFDGNGEATLPLNEMTSFFRVSLYNFLEAEKERFNQLL